MTTPTPQAIAFEGSTCVAAGPLAGVAPQVKHLLASDPTKQILVFDGVTGEPIDLDLRGTAEQVAARNAVPPVEAPREEARKAGRPKLGVVPREVTLLPRQWEWLNSQPGGASVALRRLVDEARKSNTDKDVRRTAQERAYRLMTALAGNEPGYEEAARALFAASREGFEKYTAGWPVDVRSHVRRLAEPALAA